MRRLTVDGVKVAVAHVLSRHTKLAPISSMIGPEFPPGPKEGSWLAVCVGVLGSDDTG